MTPEQQKLSQQVILLKNLVEDFRIWTSDIPATIYMKLTGTDTYHVDDPRQSVASEMFSFMFSKISDLDFPGSAVVADFLGGIVNYYKELNDKDPNSLPPDIRDICADLAIRLANTLKQLIDDLSEIEADPAGHWNDTYTIPFGDKQTIVANELNNYVIPDKNDPSTVLQYNKIVDTFRNQMTYEIVKHVIVTTKMYKIGTAQTINYIEGDFQQLIRNPEDFMPGGAGDGDEIVFNLLLGVPVYPFQLNVPYDPNAKMNGQGIMSRISTKNGAKMDWGYASSDVVNPATQSDFYKLAADHIQKIAPSAYFKVSETDPENPNLIIYRRFYLVTGDSEYNTEESSWTHNATWHCASEDLCNYLFKDDSFGNIINPDAVAMRQDVFENWALEGSKGVVPYAQNSLSYLK